MSGAGEVAMFLAIGAAAAGLLFGPLASGLADRLRGRAAVPENQGQLDELDSRVGAEMEELRRRLAEVEERLDFAERLLTHEAPANQLPGGAQQ